MGNTGKTVDVESSMSTGWCVTDDGLCQTQAADSPRSRVAAVPADRRGVYAATVLRQPKNGALPVDGGACRQPQAGAAHDARDGAGRHGTWAKHEQGASRAQGVPVPAARRTDHQGEPSVEYLHNVCAPGAWIRLSGGRNRLVQPQGAQLAHQQ